MIFRGICNLTKDGKKELKHRDVGHQKREERSGKRKQEDKGQLIKKERGGEIKIKNIIVIDVLIIGK